MKNRIDWIDIARFWGIVFIYLGHAGEASGNAYLWVFSFHVPLFFFLSGCVESLNTRNLKDNLLHKFSTILLPFYLFGILTILFQAVRKNSFSVITKYTKILLEGGIRNVFSIGSGLWFLSCLFVIQIAFSLIRKLKNKLLIFAVCLALHVFAVYGIQPNPLVEPHWYYNADSACYYLVFYCLGWILFPLVHELLCTDRPKIKLLYGLLSVVCFVYSSLLFWKKDLLLPLDANPVTHVIHNLATPMLTIFLVLSVSNLIQTGWQKRIGKSTLYLCGNEFIARKLVIEFASMFGLQIVIDNAVQACLYTLFLLELVCRLLIPLEKPVIEKMQRLFCSITGNH